jgi:hypothetical protein
VWSGDLRIELNRGAVRRVDDCLTHGPAARMVGIGEADDRWREKIVGRSGRPAV